MREREISVYIAELVQKRELFVYIKRNEWKNVKFWFKLRKKVQESDILVYIAKLARKRYLVVYITRNECTNVNFST